VTQRLDAGRPKRSRGRGHEGVLALCFPKAGGHAEIFQPTVRPRRCWETRRTIWTGCHENQTIHAIALQRPDGIPARRAFACTAFAAAGGVTVGACSSDADKPIDQAWARVSARSRSKNVAKSPPPPGRKSNALLDLRKSSRRSCRNVNTEISVANDRYYQLRGAPQDAGGRKSGGRGINIANWDWPARRHAR